MLYCATQIDSCRLSKNVEPETVAVTNSRIAYRQSASPHTDTLAQPRPRNLIPKRRENASGWHVLGFSILIWKKVLASTPPSGLAEAERASQVRFTLTTADGLPYGFPKKQMNGQQNPMLHL